MLAEIEGQVRDVRRGAMEKRRRDDAHGKAMDKATEADKKGGKRGGGGEGDDLMELDENGGRKTRGAKRGGGSMLSGFGKRLGGN